MIQSRRDWATMAPTGLTFSLLFGLGVSGLLVATAGLSARMLGQPELASLIRVLAIALAISALKHAPSGVAKTVDEFRRPGWCRKAWEPWPRRS